MCSQHSPAWCKCTVCLNFRNTHHHFSVSSTWHHRRLLFQFLLPSFRPPSITMICPDRSNNSGSNWLDRLRFNKGIPTTDDDLDLDSFLLNLTSHSPQPRPIRHRPTITDDPPLSVVLSQLFNPSSTVTLTSKKRPRKQTNPKIFLPSSAATTADNPHTITGAVAPVEVENRDEEGEDGEEDLKGFTKSEVTVIDTSCSVWKVDKFVFRKNSVWKVRERKQKNKFFAKKKSKVIHEFHIHGIGSSKDNVVNIEGEKPVKKPKVI